MTEERCPHCGASLKEHWHRMTPGLVTILAECYSAVIKKNKNKFTMHELKLDHSQYGNFQKLRFHGLIAKKTFEGEIVSRQWVITKRGAEFLKGILSIPARVKTFRNRVVDHDDQLVFVSNVFKDNIWWEKEFDYDLFDIDNKPVQKELFDL